MGRRKESLVSVLVGCPWWVSAVLAVLSWTAIVYVAPIAIADMPLFGRLSGPGFERVCMGLGGVAAGYRPDR